MIRISKKPFHEGYWLVKFYRSIRLLSVIDRVLEKVAANGVVVASVIVEKLSGKLYGFIPRILSMTPGNITKRSGYLGQYLVADNNEAGK